MFSEREHFIQKAQVAELVDAHVSGACAARREGSSPFLGTTKVASRLKFNLLAILVFKNSPLIPQLISGYPSFSTFGLLFRKFGLVGLLAFNWSLF